jgi:hypothetical protein
MVSKFVDWRNTVLNLRELRMGSTKVTATPDEINQVCDGVGPTATASNLTALTDVKDGLLAAASGGVQSTDVQLNNAQIKALPNYPTGYVEIVPAPGLGLAVVLEDAWLVADCTAGAYTNYEDSGGGIDEHALFIGYGNDVKYGSTAADFRTLVNAARVTVARLLPPVSDPVSNLPVATLAFQTAVENVENLPLKLIAYNTPGVLTGGHPDNTFSLRLRYRIVPVVPFGA